MLPGDERFQDLRLPGGGEKGAEGFHHVMAEVRRPRPDVIVGARDGDGQVLALPGARGDGAVENPLRRRVEGRSQAKVGDAAVEMDVHVDNGRAAQLGWPYAVGQGARGQHVLDEIVGEGHDDAVGFQLPCGGVDDEARGTGGGGGGDIAHGPDGGDSVRQVHLHARLSKREGSVFPVKGAQGNSAPADVAGAAVGQQAGLEDLGGHGQRRPPSGQVDGRQADEVPQSRDGDVALAVGAQPLLEGLLVQGGVIEVEVGQSQRRRAEAGPVAPRDQAEAQQRPGQVQGGRHRVPAQTGRFGAGRRPPAPGPCRAVPAGPEHGDVEAVLELHVAGRAYSAQEVEVGGAAT